MYVSITGLELRAFWHGPRFWWHAMRSMQQALSADGNLYAGTQTINGVQHTLSGWRDEQAMRAYLVSGAHIGAMKAFDAIAVGKTIGFTTDRLPDWSEVHKIWRDRGKTVEGARRSG